MHSRRSWKLALSRRFGKQQIKIVFCGEKTVLLAALAGRSRYIPRASSSAALDNGKQFEDESSFGANARKKAVHMPAGIKSARKVSERDVRWTERMVTFDGQTRLPVRLSPNTCRRHRWHPAVSLAPHRIKNQLGTL